LKPADARSLSFVLSYAAMLGLILLSSRWEGLLWRIPPPLAKALSPSLAAILLTAPLSLGVFGRVATGGIVAATLSGPIVLLFMWSLLAAAILASFLPFLDSLFAAWHQLVHGILLAVMRLGARLPSFAPAPGTEVVLASAVVVLACLFVYAYPYGESALFTASGTRRPKSFAAGKAMAISYDSPSFLKDFLESKGLAMSKRFGQNFLVDRNARQKLVAAIGAGEGVPIWEIGPGIGSVTSLLLEAGHGVTAFEIDHGFARVLQELFGSSKGFSLVEGDFVKTWKQALSSGRPEIIFGNLPYNAALAIIADLLEHPWVPPRIVFTVQKEAARRIAAGPGTKDYSAFSVLCSSVCRTTILYDIGPAAFWPQPKVTSSVILLEPRSVPIAGDDRLGFSRFVRSGFASRRKTLRNNIAAYDKAMAGRLDAVLSALDIPGEVRAEALKPEVLAQVYFALKTP
jgi:16S rRNA (adenine1518-N6/adenine1519-N6)-dimethyltransferase